MFISHHINSFERNQHEEYFDTSVSKTVPQVFNVIFRNNEEIYHNNISYFFAIGRECFMHDLESKD